MSDIKSTKLNIREDRPTALASSVHGSNVDAVGFNLLFIAQRNTKCSCLAQAMFLSNNKIAAVDNGSVGVLRAIIIDFKSM